MREGQREKGDLETETDGCGRDPVSGHRYQILASGKHSQIVCGLSLRRGMNEKEKSRGRESPAQST